MNIKQAIAGTAIIAALALNVTPVLAQTSTSSARPNPSARTNRIAEQCLRVAKGIDNRIDKFQKNKEGFVISVQNLVDRLNKLVEKADSKDLDTTEVKADLITLNDKVSKLKSDHQIFVSNLQSVKKIDCVQNSDQFRTALKDAQSQFEVLKSDFQDIKDYFKNTIKPGLQALKGQLPSPSPTP